MTASVASVLQSSHDYSADFHKLRAGIRAEDGTSYVDFVARLKPRYGIVWRDIFLGYAALAATCFLVAASAGHGWFTWVASLAGAIAIGYWIAYLQLFMHEAAHFNIARGRKRNDLVANIFTCAIAGQEIARYRRVHFQHHRAVGKANDTEQTYANALTPWFVLKTMSGVRSLEVVTRRQKHLSEAAQSDEKNFFSPWLILTLLIHGTIVGAAWHFGVYALLAAWIAGAGIFFPAFGALRNLLEHRPSPGQQAVGEHEHAVTRIFGDDLFSSTFGGAGFNRHLLHHWEPQVSYTNLKDLERFLLSTPLRDILEARRTGYWRTLKELFQWSAL
jgi:fatty acid desaturase